MVASSEFRYCGHNNLEPSPRLEFFQGGVIFLNRKNAKDTGPQTWSANDFAQGKWWWWFCKQSLDFT